MEQIELRFAELQLESVAEGLQVSGYVNKTNQWSQTLGVRKKFVERILPGTFQKAIQRGNEVDFLAEHDGAKILSSTRNGSLSLYEDEHGLFMEATIAPTSWGKDYHTLIKEGIIQNMSFGMKVVHDTWRKLADGTYERSIDDLYLAEVSAVKSPAYVQSTIQARSIEILEDVEVPDEVENENREESNQMDIETRDKLAMVLDEILATLKESKPVKEAEEVVDKVVESGKEVVEEIVEAVEEIVDAVQEKVEEVVGTVQEKTAEVVEEAKDVVEAVKETVENTVENAPDLTGYYKKLLDF